MNPAPIVIFAYNRPHHTGKLLESLKLNAESSASHLYVFIDGLKATASEADRAKREEVITLFKELKGFAGMSLSISEQNTGLAGSVISGVSSVLARHEAVIVLEDDLYCDRFFLRFMNEALELYKHEEKVACISGYIYPVKEALPVSFFIKGADCWGWATWRRAWKHFDSNAGSLLNEIRERKLEDEFDFNCSYPYTRMLQDKKEGRNSSWAVLWYASAFVKEMLCLYPGHSLITNTGNDASGTHALETDIFHVELRNEPVPLQKISPEQDARAYRIIAAFFAEHFSSEEQQSGSLKRLYRNLVPGFIRQWLYDMRHRKNENAAGWSGDYKSWEEALAASSGYDEARILQKVADAVKLVIQGKARYERDSVAFQDERYHLKLVELLNSFTGDSEELALIDFGGSLGSSYFQNRKFLKARRCRWMVVEQDHFVAAGKNIAANEELSFHTSIAGALGHSAAEVLLLSSVLPYLEKPYEWLGKLKSFNFDRIIVDRNAFIEGEKDLLTVQQVPPEIYDASYPAWFFAEKKFLAAFQDNYEMKESFLSDVTSETTVNGKRAYWKGFVFVRKK